MKPKKSSFVIIVAGLILLITNACLTPPTPPPATATPCSAATESVNLIPIQIPKDYTNWSQFTPLQAMGLLTGQVERWSDYEDIVLDDKSTYRIVITFVTPELRRAAYVTESIHLRRTLKEIQDGLDAISGEDLDPGQLRFIVTVTLKYTGDKLMDAQDKISIPFGNLLLLDRQGREISPSSYEGALLTSFDVVDGPFAAYVTFPLWKDNPCDPTVDINTDTSVTLVLKKFKIGEKEFPDYSWIINLAPLVNVGKPTLVPNPTVPSGTAVSYYLEPKMIPPTPNPGDMNALSLDNYWTDFTKFIWSKLSASNSR